MIAIVALAGNLLLTSNARAQQSPEVRATYGRGVHAFFANRTLDAEHLFSQVIAAGSTDPRVYYFRAIARMRLGKTIEAEEDMQIGAAYEARNPGRRHAIGIALQRIQGTARQTLERYRRDGRLNRAQERRQQTQQRYEQLERRNPKVLRREDPVPLDQLVDPSPKLLTTPAEPASENATTPIAPVDNAAEKATVEVPPPADDDPFSDPAPTKNKEPAKEPVDDLFGDPAPAADAPAEVVPMPDESSATEEANSVEDDLFGDPTPAADTPAEVVPMPDEGSATEEADTVEDDLFGDPAPAADAPAEVVPMPAEEDDLFGDPVPATPSQPAATDDDPFGKSSPVDAVEEPAEPKKDAQPAAEEVDDLFGSATEEAKDAAAATSGTLIATDKVESGKLMGILGRVMTKSVPWRGVRLPKIGPRGELDTAAAENLSDNFELGPSSDGEATPASAEEPANESADDLFGTVTPAAESADDLFADEPSSDDLFEPVPTTEEAPAGENTESPSDNDDPFGDF